MVTVTIDRVDVAPFHALTRADIKAIWAVVPAEWTTYVRQVRLSNRIWGHSRFVRPAIFSWVEGRLIVSDVGMEPDQARLEVMRELAMLGLKIKPSYGHKLSAQQLKDIDAVVLPLLHKLQAEAPPKLPEKPAIPEQEGEQS